MDKTSLRSFTELLMDPTSDSKLMVPLQDPNYWFNLKIMVLRDLT